jgi:hypothetical protein
MRFYIISADHVTVSRYYPELPTDGDIPPPRARNLQAASLSSKQRQLPKPLHKDALSDF